MRPTRITKLSSQACFESLQAILANPSVIALGFDPRNTTIKAYFRSGALEKTVSIPLNAQNRLVITMLKNLLVGH